MHIIPESLARLQATAFVKNAELARIGRDRIIANAAEELARTALHKLLSDCIETIGDYMGYQGQVLKLDCYVISPRELDQIITNALVQGRRDAEWESMMLREER